MEPRDKQLGLIGNRSRAAIALCATGFVAAQSFRGAFSRAPRSPHWLLSFEPFPLPFWVVAVANVAFYLCIVWGIADLYRNAHREERIVVAGWLGSFLLIPLQHLASARGAAAIQWVKATGMGVAFLAAAYILVRSSWNTDDFPKVAKNRLLVILAVLATAIMLGAIIYFLPLH